MNYRWNLKQHITLFQKYFKLDEYTVSHDLFAGGHSQEFTREIFERGRVVAVVLYDPVLDKLVLIEQFRAGAIKDVNSPWLIECVAGVIDPGQSPEQVAKRETEEEAGCEIKKLLPIGGFYLSPGGTSEYCHMFCGIVDAKGVGGFHGLASENEDIRVFTLDAEKAFAQVRDGRIKSAASIIGLQWLELNRSALKTELSD